jgi:hypothetical protein
MTTTDTGRIEIGGPLADKLAKLTAALEAMNADHAAKVAAFREATSEADGIVFDPADLTPRAAAVFMEGVARNSRIFAGLPATAEEYLATPTDVAIEELVIRPAAGEVGGKARRRRRKAG